MVPDCFRISVDGRHLRDFPHRGSPAEIRAVCSTILIWRLEDSVRGGNPTEGQRRGTAHPPQPVPAPRGSSPADWVAAEDNPPQPDSLSSFRFFAVLGTRMEENVVAATVANCFRQGCERVYLVDNASPDRTVERAVAAGAVAARSFSTERYDEPERIRQMQAGRARGLGRR